MKTRRVVVTGLGTINPLGNSVDQSWQALLAGQSGIAPIEAFDTEGFSTNFGGTIKDFDVTQWLTVKEAKKVDLFIQYSLAASIDALQDAKIDKNPLNAARIGVAIGSGIGGLNFIEKNHNTVNKSGPRRVSPFFVPGSVINMAAGNLAVMYGLKGPNFAITTACTTGTHNIGYAARTIAYGDADIMVCGGAEMATTPLGIAGFSAARALSTRCDDPQKASRPWDADRDGFVLGDGAGTLVLEELEHAQKRGATIYAELAGFGMSDDGFHITSPPENGEGAATAMQCAIDDAGLNASDVQYINAHGTSTLAGDIAESRAVESVFGDSSKHVAVSSTKSMTGHLLGAAGAIEAIFTILAIRDQVAPPTINLDNIAEGCNLDYVPNKKRSMKIDAAISNSFGFGGTNGSLLFKRFS